ncbi:50S ribosomal protein L11 methyltransferase [Ferrovibrio sp.]|uniref:50S ribosomal protein L11 methyltransferase n=1 Tax=Ferrovibrio sp. TaxID=1917215 RepID=UPI0035AFAF4A
MAEFWFVEIEMGFPQLEPFEELLGETEDSVAVSSYEVAPMPNPDDAHWRLQILFDAPPDMKAWKQRLAGIAKSMGLKDAPISGGHLPDQDWVRHTNIVNAPIHAGRFYLYGAHDAGSTPPGAKPLLLDAGLAFGTGRAPSTYGCLQAIDLLARHKALRTALDFGCGSGVLAMAAARCMPADARLLAADIDPVAVEVAKNNARLNGLSARIQCLIANRPDAPLLRKAGPFDLVLANILAGPLRRMARDLSRRVAPGGYLVLSGLLAHEDAAVFAAYRSQGLLLEKRIAREGWHTLVLQRRH